MTLYQKMNKTQAVEALEEFLRERGPARQRLAELMAADGLNPDSQLDGSIDSLAPVWRWAKSRLTRKDPASGEFHGRWLPTWLKHILPVEEPTLSYQSVLLIDGMISYFCEVVEQAAPEARWRLGYDRHKNYFLQNRPVLGNASDEYDPAWDISTRARGYLEAAYGVGDDDLAVAATRMAERLRGDDDAEVDEPEPLAEVSDLREEDEHPLRPEDFDFDITLHEEVAHEHSRLVDRMVRDLRKQQGVREVHREDREVLLVRAPSWDATRLEAWTTQYLAERLDV